MCVKSLSGNQKISMSIRQPIRQAGFTMVELLIVVTLSVMLMLGATALFMTFLIGNTRTNADQTVKAEGEYALSQIEFLLRNSVELISNSYGQECEASMQEIAFLSYDGGVTYLFGEEDEDGFTKIASNSGVYLTSSDVDITSGPIFNCEASDDGLIQYVDINFTLRKGTPGVNQANEIVEQTFSTGVNVRSY